jgi:hypothetical protein
MCSTYCTLLAIEYRIGGSTIPIKKTSICDKGSTLEGPRREGEGYRSLETR